MVTTIAIVLLWSSWTMPTEPEHTKNLLNHYRYTIWCRYVSLKKRKHVQLSTLKQNSYIPTTTTLKQQIHSSIIQLLPNVIWCKSLSLTHHHRQSLRQSTTANNHHTTKCGHTPPPTTTFSSKYVSIQIHFFINHYRSQRSTSLVTTRTINGDLFTHQQRQQSTPPTAMIYNIDNDHTTSVYEFLFSFKYSS